ncbi:dihydrofolate reductase family protein [Nocardioides sp. TRM66260-LWL]|uniref:dihydrofolate reductase family protein n=1 Tax=Nocardioides sp. TRM66260-LWL TaxID=2874478 RepID=UPI001CC57357|nr:dihydrofolate reductase family protein [Nocardioides sp. TRM66260-LWL]MBZ5734720.1 dihydrofolate reductase family protein [Nocardioides sp. TRM66260-LWL]
MSTSRTLIVTAFMSLDGVMEAPGGEPGYRSSGWTMSGVEPDMAAYELKGREQDEAAALLLGRVSYEAFAPVWPSMTEVFPRYNAMPRYVVSSTLEHDDERWPATVLRSVDDVAALKQRPEADGSTGPIIVHGSARLGAALADAGLVDRYHLLTFPVLLGEGRRLFSESAHPMQRLRVVESTTHANGITAQVLDVLR